MRRVYLPLWFVVLLAACGCQQLTPAQKAEADQAKAAFTAASTVLDQVQQAMAEHVREYQAIKALVDAGQSIPAAAFGRFQELQKLITSDAALVNDAVSKFNAAKAANDKAAAAGVTWYNRVPWGTVAQVGGGILLGLAGMYFPVVRPLATAGQAIIKGVAAVSANDPAAEQAIKDAVLEASRCLGAEAKVDALVQKYDPPSLPQSARG